MIELTLGELMDMVCLICPQATTGEDNDGQLVIYTDMRVDKEDNLHPLEPN